MKLNQLRDVVAIAERGSLRAASRQIGVAQPALTRSIRELERELGAALFERRTKGMVLTPVGQVFLRRARAALGEIRRAEEEVDQIKGGTSGSVVAALSIVPHLAMLPRVLRRFRRRYPNVTLQIIEGVYPNVESQLRDGSIDFYVGPSSQDALPPDLLEEPMSENPRLVMCRRDHPLAEATSLADLTGAEWATTSITQNAEDELHDLFSGLGLPSPRLSVRTRSAMSLLIAVAYSDVLAMVPHQWTSFELFRSGVRQIHVKEPLTAARIVAVRRAGMPLTPAAEHVLDLMRRQVAEAYTVDL
ncbi:MAG: LysR family transcriptional regulator [Rhodobacteraceae bacterium]|nr:LysR family transcriptional regulator [Paracoccaceae bacterium]MBR9821036.1 LysR family transcriptional regulator [Paracoccaceae bacterium]